jgi:DNA-directed RNA polymerase omega subunit
MTELGKSIKVNYVPLEDLIDKTGYSIYKLVVLAAKRALEIAAGQPKLVDVDASFKPSAVALIEIASGKIVYKQGKQ